MDEYSGFNINEFGNGINVYLYSGEGFGNGYAADQNGFKDGTGNGVDIAFMIEDVDNFGDGMSKLRRITRYR